MFITGKFDVSWMTFSSRSIVTVYVPTANEKGMYTKLWTKDYSEGVSKCR